MTKHIVRNIAVILLTLGCVTKQQFAINIHLYEKNLSYSLENKPHLHNR